MKLLHLTGAIVSLAFAATGFFWLWKLNLFGRGLGICVMAFPAALALGLGLYVFHLRDRIAALEKTPRQGN
jgi:hypothetical protein